MVFDLVSRRFCCFVRGYGNFRSAASCARFRESCFLLVSLGLYRAQYCSIIGFSSFLGVCRISLLLFFLSLINGHFRRLASFFKVARRVIFFRVRFIARLGCMESNDQRVRFCSLFVKSILRILSSTTRAVSINGGRGFVDHFRVQRSSALPVERSAFSDVFREFYPKGFHVKCFLVAVLGTKVSQVIFQRNVKDCVVAPTPSGRLFVPMFDNYFTFIRSLRVTMVFFVRTPTFLCQGPILVRPIRCTVRHFRHSFGM